MKRMSGLEAVKGEVYFDKNSKVLSSIDKNICKNRIFSYVHFL